MNADCYSFTFINIYGEKEQFTVNSPSMPRKLNHIYSVFVIQVILAKNWTHLDIILENNLPLWASILQYKYTTLVVCTSRFIVHCFDLSNETKIYISKKILTSNANSSIWQGVNITFLSTDTSELHKRKLFYDVCLEMTCCFLHIYFFVFCLEKI